MGHEPFPVYTASKCPVIRLAKSAALTCGQDCNLCNVVCPGLVRTKLVYTEYVLKKTLPGDPTPPSTAPPRC